MDQFLIGALEVDVDLVRGTDWVLIGGVVEHIEAAGIHSGDSMGVLPPQRLKEATSSLIEDMSIQLANELNVIGHLNLQLAIKNDEVYVLEANPRSSRSVPFIVKATGIPLVDLAIEASLLKKKSEIKLQNMNWKNTDVVSVKGVVFPFKKFAEADSLLGPEMKSTGESMGRAKNYPEALMKAFQSSHVKLPESGEVFFSLREKDKSLLIQVARQLSSWGYSLSATKGTADFFNSQGLNVKTLRKVHEGRPNCVDHIRVQKIALVINTAQGKNSIEASFDIRRACLDYGIPCLTEADTVMAFILALQSKLENKFEVKSLDRTISF
jgi:carbamoyl-phosphate synthase large subunit